MEAGSQENILSRFMAVAKPKWMVNIIPKWGECPYLWPDGKGGETCDIDPTDDRASAEFIVWALDELEGMGLHTSDFHLYSNGSRELSMRGLDAREILTKGSTRCVCVLEALTLALEAK